MAAPIPVLELGGTHVTAALVDMVAGSVVPGSRRRRPLRADGSGHEILAGVLDCAAGLAGSSWGVAVPGPFDYDRGIAWFEGVGKFDALYGVDVGRVLRDRLPGAPVQLTFLNDAEAFLLGEWIAGAATGHDRAIGITLGSGVGSAFIADGLVVTSGPDVPPGGRADLLQIGGSALEEVVSRRAIIRAYARATQAPADGLVDVREIADRARSGEAPAAAALDEAFVALGEALGPWADRFRATIIVVGGAMTGSWDLIKPPLRRGLAGRCPELTGRCRIAWASHGDDAALLGAAWAVATGGPGPRSVQAGSLKPSAGAGDI